MTIFGKEITRFLGTPSRFFIIVGNELHWFDGEGAARMGALEAESDVGIAIQFGKVDYTVLEVIDSEALADAIDAD